MPATDDLERYTFTEVMGTKLIGLIRRKDKEMEGCSFKNIVVGHSRL